MATSSRTTEQLGRVLAGRYRLLSLIGSGASAQVYLADDVQLQRQVAVKLLHEPLAADEAFLRRFEGEARTAAALNHPHILAIYDVGTDGAPFLVTELLAGGSLQTMLDSGVRLSLSQALVVGLEAARGLDHAHRHGVVHRDLKPANLLFGDEGRLRIADFGLARALAEAAVTEVDGSPLGTARYTSPEQARGEPVGPPGDIYSLGLVLAEAVTGRSPFEGDTQVAMLAARLESAPRLPDDLGPLLGPLSRATRVDPGDRPDASELAYSLLAAAQELPRPDPMPLQGIGGVAVTPDSTRSQPAPGVLVGEGGPEVGVEVEVPGEAFSAGPARIGGEVEAAEAPGAGAAHLGGSGELGSIERPVTWMEGDAPAETRTSRREAPRRQPALYDQEADEGEEPRRWLAVVVSVLIALGAAGVAGYAWWSSRTPVHEVPELVGATEDELDELVGEKGWELEIIYTRLEGTDEGEVVAQDPEAGTDLSEGGTLLVTVSLGNPLAPLPTDLVGLELEEAAARIEDAGFVLGEVERTHDEEAPEGSVLGFGESIEGVEELPLRSPLDLVVSDGPAPRTIPDLVGAPYAEAVASLEELGLEVVREERASRTVEKDSVISLEPGTGSVVEKGSKVTVVVSTGPPWINMPDVIGLSPSEAADVLEEKRLKVAGTEGPPNKDVVDTDPRPGEPVREGSEVTLITKEQD